MDFKILKYYVEIIKKESISKAAESLFIAQPSLSAMLKKLEQEIGATLIHRQKKKWEVTEAGWSFYEYATQTLNNFHYLKNTFQDLERGVGGAVRIGVASACIELLIEYITAFSENYPKIQLFIVNGTTEEIHKKLENREIDVALILEIDDIENYRSKKLQPFVCCTAVPKSWGWGERTSIKLADFHSKPFILLEPMETILHSKKFNKKINEQIETNVKVHCKDITMAIQLAARNVGFTIVPKLKSNAYYKDAVDFIQPIDLHFEVPPTLIMLKNVQMSKAAHSFWEFVN